MKALVFGVKIGCLLDTGSTATILHSGKYFEIPNHVRPTLDPSSTANGQRWSRETHRTCNLPPCYRQ